MSNDDKRDVDLFLSHGDQEVGNRSNETTAIVMKIGSIEKVCVWVGVVGRRAVVVERERFAREDAAIAWSSSKASEPHKFGSDKGTDEKVTREESFQSYLLRLDDVKLIFVSPELLGIPPTSTSPSNVQRPQRTKKQPNTTRTSPRPPSWSACTVLHCRPCLLTLSSS